MFKCTLMKEQINFLKIKSNSEYYHYTYKRSTIVSPFIYKCSIYERYFLFNIFKKLYKCKKLSHRHTYKRSTNVRNLLNVTFTRL